MRHQNVMLVMFALCVNVASSLAQTPQETADDAAAVQPVITPPVQLNVPDSERPEFGELVGAVVFLLTIDESGVVTAVAVHETSGLRTFDEKARAEVLEYTFAPALSDGVPIAVQVLYRFEVKPMAVEPPPKEDVAPKGRLQGTVFLKGTRRPLVGVEVEVLDRELTTYTDANGVFTFPDLEVGEVRISIREDGFYSYTDKQVVAENEQTDVTYYVEPETADAGVLTVRAKRPKKEVTRRTLQIEEVIKIPGVNGDVVKVVQNLPGVARIPFGGGGLIIRGSNPGDAGAVVNGHFVPLIFHFGGLRSIVPSELIERIDFYPGNYSVRYGRFSGGIVDLEIKRPDEDWRLRAEADVFDAGFYLSGPLSDRTRFAIAGRRSYIDALLPLVLPKDGNFDLTVAPRYYDYQLLIDHKTSKHHAQFLLFGSDDALDFVLDEPINADPALRGDFENRTRFLRMYGKLSSKLTPSLRNEVSISVGPNEVFAQLGTNLRFDNSAWVVTAREALAWQVDEAHQLTFGLDFETYQAKIDILAPFPPKEGGDRGQRLSSRELVSAQRDSEILNLAGWIEHEYKTLQDRLLLVSGLRYDYDRRLEEGSFDPRFSLRLGVLPKRLFLKGGVGWFSQRPSPDESDPSFGDPNIHPERAIHYSLGGEWRFSELVELDIVAFYKDLYDLIDSPSTFTAESIDPTSSGRILTNDGRGRSYGAEVLLRHAPSGQFFGWVSYTLMRSERYDEATASYRLFDFDQTHILTILGQFKFNSKWELGARYRFVTGIPQTPIVGSIYNSRDNVYEPILGPQNSTRLPSFQQLDLRVDRIWRFDTWTMNGYLEIQNLYNYANVEGYRYDYDFQNKRPVTGLPIIPSLGIRGTF